MTEAVSPPTFGLQPGDVILDVGCADGKGTTRIAAFGYTVLGLELEQHLLAELRSDAHTRALDVCRGDATNIPMGDCSVDGVVMIEVLEHIPDTTKVLAEIHRVVRTGGRVCIAVPTGYTERLFSRLHPRYLSNAEHIHRFELGGLCALIEAAGIRVDRVTTRNLAPAVAWFIHSVIRTTADATGRVLSRRWIDSAVAAAFAVLRILPLVRGIVAAIEAKLGKSWYIYGTVT